MSEATKTVEVVCTITTFDEEVYQAGKTYQVAEDLLARYPDSFRSADWKDPAVAEKVQAEQSQLDGAARTQEGYERARDHALLMEVGSEIELRRQRKELEEQIKKQHEENRKADREAVEISGWQPKPPPKAEPPAAQPAPTVRTSGPAHTLPRAERLKNAR